MDVFLPHDCALAEHLPHPLLMYLIMGLGKHLWAHMRVLLLVRLLECTATAALGHRVFMNAGGLFGVVEPFWQVKVLCTYDTLGTPLSLPMRLSSLGERHVG